MIDEEFDSAYDDDDSESEPIPRLFTVMQGDISLLQMRDGGVVNPSNTGLILGSGVSESIARRAGPDFQQKLHMARSGLFGNRLDPGKVLDTDAGGLNVKRVLHVSLIGKKKVDRKLITNALLNIYDRAEELGLRALAIPPLGVGLGKFPLSEFVELFFQITTEELPRSESVEHVVFCLADESEFRAATEYIEAHRAEIPEIITLETNRATNWAGGLG